MAVNKSVGDNARKDAVRKRSQIKTAIGGEEHWTKRSRSSVSSWIKRKIRRPRIQRRRKRVVTKLPPVPRGTIYGLAERKSRFLFRARIIS